MKNSIFFSMFLAVLAVSFFLPGQAYATVNATLYIQGPGGSVLVNTSLAVPEACTVQDSAGTSHTFSGHKAICALQVAKNSGIITSFAVTDWGFGFSLDSINGIINAPDWSELWQLWKNGTAADVGIQGIVLSAGDMFQLTYGPWVTNIVSAPQTPGGPVITDIYPRRLRIEDAVSFLVANQQTDGSWGHSLFTDWVAIALGAYKGNSTSAFYAKNALVQWMTKNPIPEGSVITDFERRAMALMALGINPYNGTGTDYIKEILKGFDGKQFGNVNLVNDDIFALLVLLKAGYQQQEEPVAGALGFVLDSQRENGSWGDVDMTAATIQMLDLVSPSKERDQALSAAKEYLEGKQESTGGFGNVYSTSWVLQAISAMQENGDSWVIDNRTPEHFLALHQTLDGGLLSAESKENRIWATSYAMPAALAKSWGSILAQFEKPSFLQVQTPAAPATQETEALATVEKEIVRISKEVAVLRSEVLAFAILQHIAQEVNRIALETKAVEVGVVQFRIQQIAKTMGQPSPIAQVPPLQIPPQDLSGVTLPQKDKTAPLAAEAKEAVGAAGLSPQLIILLVIIGAAVFAFSGSMNTVLSYLRRTFSKV